MARRESLACWGRTRHNTYYRCWPRLKLAFQSSPGYQHGGWYGRQHGTCVLPAYSYGCARARDGNNLLRACAIPEYAAGALGMTKVPLVRATRMPNVEGPVSTCILSEEGKEVSCSVEYSDEKEERKYGEQFWGLEISIDPVSDPNLDLNVEALNKEFMAQSEELYDLLMNCHWQPLDSVESNIPDNSLE